MQYGTDNPPALLHRAIIANANIDIIRELLNHGAQVESSHITAAFNHPNLSEILVLLIESVFKPYTKSRYIVQALFDGVSSINNKDLVLPALKLVLSRNSSVAESKMATRALVEACQLNQVNMVQLLIKYGVDVNKQDQDVSPLCAAATLPKSTILKMLIYARVRINDLSSTPITDRTGNDRILYYLAKRNRSIKQCPIHVAYRKKVVENIQVLFHHGADIQATDSQGQTPLSLIGFCKSTSNLCQMTIRYLAISSSKGLEINVSDLRIIECLGKHKYYVECLNELESMKLNNAIVYSLFEKNMSEIAYETRSSGFAEKYNEAKWKKEFPIYRKEIEFVLKTAKTRKNALSKREEAIREALQNVLPNIPLEKLIHYFYWCAI